jgi:hypothetical protein
VCWAARYQPPPIQLRDMVPVKASIRKAEKLEQGDTVTVRLEVRS